MGGLFFRVSETGAPMSQVRTFSSVVRAGSFSLILIASTFASSLGAWGARPELPPAESVTPDPAISAPAASPAASTTAEAARHRRAPLASRRGRLITRITAMAHQMEGVPYVFGGTSAHGVDCSGFTQRIFALAGIQLRRMADEQYQQGRAVEAPQAGDLVFFSTYLPGPSHVGIYLGNRYFIHASSSRGVTVSSLEESYYRSRYIGARRFF